MNRAYKFPNEPATCSRTLRASSPFQASNGHPRFALIYLPPRFRFAYLPRERKGEGVRESCRFCHSPAPVPRFVQVFRARARTSSASARTDGRACVISRKGGRTFGHVSGVLSGSSMRLARTLLFTPTETRGRAEEGNDARGGARAAAKVRPATRR